MPPWRPTVRGLPRLLNQTSAVKDAYLRYRAGPQGANPRSDWMHATLFRPMPADVRVGRRLACTVHDMIPELLGLPTDSGPHQGKLELAKRSDLILVISESTASCLKEMAPSLADRIVVVPLGVQYEHFGAPSKPPGGVNFPYVLFIGARTGYKRFDLAIEAIRRASINFCLGIVGPPLNPTEILELNVKLGSRWRFFGSVSSSRLRELYSSVYALIFPSDCEGFGLPLLEAMACNCPVVAAGRASLPEVGGSAALYSDRQDPDEYTNALVSLGSPSLRMQHIYAGSRQAATFTWERTCALTQSLYLDG